MNEIIQIGNLVNHKVGFKNPERGRVYDKRGICPTLNTVTGGGLQPKIIEDIKGDNMEQNYDDYRIRKLTPKECWRLQGFTDEDFDKAKWMSENESAEFLKQYPKTKRKRNPLNKNQIERTSDTQMYKMAGNSITVNVLYYIFKELYKAMPYLFEDLSVGSFFSGIGAFECSLNRLYKDINNTGVI